MVNHGGRCPGAGRGPRMGPHERPSPPDARDGTAPQGAAARARGLRRGRDRDRGRDRRGDLQNAGLRRGVPGRALEDPRGLAGRRPPGAGRLPRPGRARDPDAGGGRVVRLHREGMGAVPGVRLRVDLHAGRGPGEQRGARRGARGVPRRVFSVSAPREAASRGSPSRRGCSAFPWPGSGSGAASRTPSPTRNCSPSRRSRSWPCSPPRPRRPPRPPPRPSRPAPWPGCWPSVSPCKGSSGPSRGTPTRPR